MSRDPPGGPAGGLPAPPLSFDDAEGREIAIRRYADREDEEEALVRMYASFDPADRAQGIPPRRDAEIRDWLATLLDEEAVNVLAYHGERVVGHAMLVPDDEGAYELAIFIHQAYQGAGIGTRLVRCLLGEAAARGIERVWLTVERWNDAALALYRSVGFEATDAGGFEMEMELELH